MCVIRELRGCVKGLSLSVKVLDSHPVRVEVAPIWVAIAGETVL